MSEKSIPDFIQSILEEHKGFMKVKDLPTVMDFDMRRKLGLVRTRKPSAVTIKRILEPVLEDRFIFSKKGNTPYILVPRDPSEFVLAALGDKPVSPKIIKRSLPFNDKDFADIVNELAMSGRIRIILNENVDARIILSDVHEGHEESVRSVKSSGEYTRDRFKKAFDELERGQTFVNIPELRKKLSWPHDVFDDMIRKLRDEEVIVLHVTDRTNFEPEEFFYDEADNARMGMVTWHDR